jgi:hypothetical protein
VAVDRAHTDARLGRDRADRGVHTGDDEDGRGGLDRLCAAIERDPAEITRSIHLPVAYDDAPATRHAIAEAVDAGFTHVILGLRPPYPEHVAHRVADELIS